mgnify:FL=1
MLEAKHKAVVEEARRREAGPVDDMALCFSILALASAIDRDCAARLKPYHLSEGKFVLVILLQAEPEGLSPNVLAQRAGVTRATIAGLLDGVERDALVARESSLADRRMITVQLTAAGQRRATDLGATHTAWIISLMGKLEPDEKAQLGALLARVWAQTDAGREAIL